ncbi:MAG: Firmicu-CTERM sorting domain-containing protein [Oscillospiraceae bacterium]|nr:Firmicu-CTERM sorting domain-containing protein [Oscillospiraceae bacterium]
MTKKIQLLLVSILVTLLLISVPVFAAEGDDVIVLSDVEATDYVGITIDGYFSDWSDKPMSPIYYDPGTSHIGSLYRDETYVYLYIQMSDTGYTEFNGYGYEFTVDGKLHTFNILPVSDSIGNGNTTMQVVRVNGNQPVPGANGIVNRTTGQGDRMEMRIPLTYFPRQPDMITTITFQSDNLGPQVLTATGTPTLPFIIAGSGVVVASLGYLSLKRKRAK